MSLRFHEIAEADHRILNPFTDDKLRLLGEICNLDRSTRVLDLCCGKAEMLCTWSAAHGIAGVGVDVSEVFLAAANQRAAELGVADRLSLIRAEAAGFAAASESTFDVVSCLGASWIGNGVIGTIALMAPRLSDGGLLLVGEPYWIDPLPEAESIVGVHAEDFTSLIGTLDRFKSAGFNLVEMVLADGDDWDRYVASQWLTVETWLRANPADPEANELRQWIMESQQSYLRVERRHLGWGVFVLRQISG